MENLVYFWAVYRHPGDITTPQEALPIVTFPAHPGSNFWLAQNAKQALQRRGIRCYQDLSQTYEGATA